MEHILSLSYGEDSIACIEAIKRLGLPLDRIVHAEVWATDTIPADLPPMVEFKEKADRIIKKRYGIEVEHVCAKDKDGGKLTFEKMFYSVPKRKEQNKRLEGCIRGFPPQAGAGHYCLKLKSLALPTKSKGIVEYYGITADEKERIERHEKNGVVLPLVQIGWTGANCYLWCNENDLLSPIYKTTARGGGCWFCIYQSLQDLRNLRKQYPELWDYMMKWDIDSPIAFHADGHTVHDFDRRFNAEEEGKVPTDRKFRWKMLEEE